MIDIKKCEQKKKLVNMFKDTANEADNFERQIYSALFSYETSQLH